MKRLRLAMGIVLAMLLGVLQAVAQTCNITTGCEFITGNIQLGTSVNSFTLTDGQKILAVDNATNTFLPDTSLCSSSGSYGVVGNSGSAYWMYINEPTSFTDTLSLVLVYTSGGITSYYPLQTTTSGGTNVIITYSGTVANTTSYNFVPTPQQQGTAYVGAQLTPTSVPAASPCLSNSTGSSSSTTGGATTASTGPICPTAYPNCDVNGDGVFDKNDINFIKNALSGRNPNPKADFNGDGVVNTQDLIDAMRALAQWQAAKVQGQVGTGSSGTSSSTSGSSTSSTTSASGQ